MNSTKIGIALNQKRKVLNHLCAGAGSKRHLFGWFKSKSAEVRFQIGLFCTRSLIGWNPFSEKARRSIGWNIYKKWIAMGSRKIWKERISWMGRWHHHATTISIHLFNVICCHYFFSHSVSKNLRFMVLWLAGVPFVLRNILVEKKLEAEADFFMILGLAKHLYQNWQKNVVNDNESIQLFMR